MTTLTTMAASITVGRTMKTFDCTDSGSTYLYIETPAKAPTMKISPWAKLMSWMIP